MHAATVWRCRWLADACCCSAAASAPAFFQRSRLSSPQSSPSRATPAKLSNSMPRTKPAVPAWRARPLSPVPSSQPLPSASSARGRSSAAAAAANTNGATYLTLTPEHTLELRSSSPPAMAGEFSSRTANSSKRRASRSGRRRKRTQQSTPSQLLPLRQLDLKHPRSTLTCNLPVLSALPCLCVLSLSLSLCFLSATRAAAAGADGILGARGTERDPFLLDTHPIRTVTTHYLAAPSSSSSSSSGAAASLQSSQLMAPPPIRSRAQKQQHQAAVAAASLDRGFDVFDTHIPDILTCCSRVSLSASQCSRLRAAL
jgi:hypothetical protein